jgi:hypothetical protein
MEPRLEPCLADGSPDLVATILLVLDEAHLDTFQLTILAKKIDDLYSFEANKIAQSFPTDLWHYVFQKASLSKIPVLQLLPLRLVCQTWNKIISDFPKLNTQTGPSNRFKLFRIFRLKSFNLPSQENAKFVDFSLLTGLQELRIPVRDDLSPDMSEFAPLTNLTKITLSSNTITSLGPLTSITCLSLKKPYVLKRPEIDKLPRLKRLVSNKRDVFPSGEGIYKRPLPHGDRYEGQWNNNARCGHGVMHLARGEVYEGNWENHKRSGYGISKFADGNRYEGNWHAPEKGRSQFSGYGVMHYANGRKYSGNWEEGKPHGHGILDYGNGQVWEGKWYKGELIPPLFQLIEFIE